ncbi:MAG TPA: L-threonylcarbamoyladenylate synthase, partial [Myxococcota bacterium]|nr:L-threonylcarbamoyladenylate synthase [Myxococcota bacterium]HQK51919.1 L-threonylcarbamoyladenylate synthase [Myxococcota bacterium]
MHDASDGTPGRRGLFLVGDPSAAGSEGVWQAVGQSLEVWALGEAPTVCGALEAWGVAVHRAPLRSETAEAPAAVAASMREIARERSLDLDRSFLVTDRPEVLEVLGTTGGTGILVWEGEGPDPRGEVGEGVVVLPGLADALPTLREGKPDAEDTALARAARRIRHGGIVAFPTETVYGLGANALHPRAVARIFQVKRRPFFDPLIVHLEDRAWVDRLARQVPSGARRLMDRFWPGPLTLVLPRTPLVPDLVTAGLDTVGLRMPAHPMARALIRA